MMYWVAMTAFLIDQVSKLIMLHGLKLADLRGIDVMPPLLRFRYGENRGINFGLFGDAPDLVRWFLVAFSMAVILGIWWWVRRFETDRRMMLCAGLLIGGALGNVVDRVAYGFVIDFLNMSCCGINNPYVFNIADVFIFVGAIGLILFEGRAQGNTVT